VIPLKSRVFAVKFRYKAPFISFYRTLEEALESAFADVENNEAFTELIVDLKNCVVLWNDDIIALWGEKYVENEEEE